MALYIVHIIFIHSIILTQLYPLYHDHRLRYLQAFSSVPYEKGFNFLFYLETVVGGLDTFLLFARAYFDKFKYSTITTEEFKAFFLEHFSSLGSKLDVIEWDKWLYSSGT